jgi:hypothetical protein
MKKTILTLALFSALFLTANTAKGVIFYSNGEKVEVVKTLPEDVIIEDAHFNLGVMYEQFAIFWIPMWNYGETKYVLINDKKDTYYDLSEEDVEDLCTEFNIDVPKKPTIGFWNKIGGKLIWCVVIVAAIYGWWISRKDNE